MKNFLFLICILTTALLVAGTQAWAVSWTIEDDYVGSNAGVGSQWLQDSGALIGDVVSLEEEYDIYNVSQMNIDLTGNNLTVDIITGYNKAYDPTNFGDLFISTNSNSWNYAFDTSAGMLYQIDENNIITSDMEMDSHGIDYSWYRHDEAVLIDNTGLVSIGDGTAAYANGQYSMNFDLSASGIDFGSDVTFHWTMTCANDVIEGKISEVPEPGTMLLLGIGLIGLTGISRRKNR